MCYAVVREQRTHSSHVALRDNDPHLRRRHHRAHRLHACIHIVHQRGPIIGAPAPQPAPVRARLRARGPQHAARDLTVGVGGGWDDGMHVGGAGEKTCSRTQVMALANSKRAKYASPPTHLPTCTTAGGVPWSTSFCRTSVVWVTTAALRAAASSCAHAAGFACLPLRRTETGGKHPRDVSKRSGGGRIAADVSVIGGVYMGGEPATHGSHHVSLESG